MATAPKRKIVEEGIVLSKEFKAATQEFTNSEGKVIPAAPDRYIVKVASSGNITKENGLEDTTILEYKVDKAIFETLGYLSKVRVSYNFSSYRMEPLSLEVISK